MASPATTPNAVSTSPPKPVTLPSNTASTPLSSSTSTTTNSNPIRPPQVLPKPTAAARFRYAPIGVFFISFICTLLAIVATVTHTYIHPLELLSRWFGTPSLGVVPYQSQQTCEMSYFFLSHQLVPIEYVSPITQTILDGQMRFGLDSTAERKNQPLKRRTSGEFDDEDEELNAIELEEATTSTPSPASSTALSTTQSLLAADFASFTQLFQTAIPRTGSARYRLYQYFEHDNSRLRSRHQRSRKSRQTPAHNKKRRIPILFIHGNGGGYHQMRSLASRLTTIYTEERDPKTAHEAHIPDLNDYYSVDFFEESGAFSGRLLWRQAWYINEAIGEILSRYPTDTQLILVGHSMGGIVSRLLWSLGNFPRDSHGRGRIAMLVTLGSPHRAPVIQTDEYMKRLYRIVSQAQATPSGANDDESSETRFVSSFTHLSPLLNLNSSIFSEKPFIVSIAGGERDYQIEPALADLDGLYSSDHTLSLTSHSLHYGPLSESGGLGVNGGTLVSSIDHQCLCWCKQLVETLGFSIREFTRNLLATRLNTTRLTPSEMLERQQRIWIPEVVPTLRNISSAAAASTPPVDSSSPTSTKLEWELYEEPFVSTKIDFTSIEDGLISVWNGLMASVALCPIGVTSGATCKEISSYVRTLAPLQHPEHLSLTHQTRLSKRVGLMSTYLLHVTSTQIQSLLPSQHTFQLVMQPEEATRQVIRQLRPLRDGSKRLLGYGMAYRLETAGQDQRIEFTNRGAVQRWSRHISAGLDVHFDIDVELTKRGENEYPLPQLITLFSTSLASEDQTASNFTFSPSTYSDQLFTFYPHANVGVKEKQSRPVHIYRSGFDRTLVGLIIRLPDRIGRTKESASESSSTLTIQLHDHSLISFLHTLYLQFPILPQILLGTLLIIFGIQHEYLRKYGNFPRMYQLFALPQTWGLKDLLASSFIWCFTLIVICFILLFHGGLIGDPTMAFTTDDSSNGLISGFTLSHDKTYSIGLIGIILFMSCIMLILIIDSFIYGLLWCGAWIIRMVGRLFSKMCGKSISPPTAAESTSAKAPQQRFLSSVWNRILLGIWIGSFTMSGIFTTSLALFDLKYFGGMSFLDTIWYVNQQLCAWLSTILFTFGLISEHFYFQRDILDWIDTHMMLDNEVSIILLMGGLILFAVIMQMATFPDTTTTPATASTVRSRSALSTAAYKSSGLTVMLFIVAILVVPQFLASLRLDVASLEDAAKRQAQASQSELIFWPAGAAKVYDQTMVVLPPVLTHGKDTIAPTTSTPPIWLFPFKVQSIYDPLSVIALTCVTFISWCLFHVPFSPPILQSACITTYGFALLFVHGPAVAFLNFWWIVLMLNLCLLPHAMASGLYIINLIWDFIDGKIGQYDQLYEQERMKQYLAQQQQSTNATSSSSSSSPSATRETKKHK